VLWFNIAVKEVTGEKGLRPEINARDDEHDEYSYI